MSCLHPLKGFRIGTKKSGKPDYLIVSYDVEYIVVKKYRNNKKNYVCVNTSLNEYIPVDTDVGIITDFIEIPCGKCISCRRRYAALWTDRLMLELQDHKESCFITLTYDDDHICCVDSPIEENVSMYTLNKVHLQCFWKRLRQYLVRHVEPEKRIRYFACGEYGDTTFRPHYHAILFGWRPTDLIQFKKNFQNDTLYLSKSLASIWQNGNVMVGDVTPESCRYVARYCLKKATGFDSEIYERLGVLPEFVTMSRKPGIARKYFDDHYDEIIKYKTINLSTLKGGMSMQIPPYFIRLIEDIDSELFKEIKRSNKQAALNHQEALMKNTDVDYITYLSFLEGILVREEKFYRRDRIV
nr:unnamed protein product [uncultured bacterium]